MQSDSAAVDLLGMAKERLNKSLIRRAHVCWTCGTRVWCIADPVSTPYTMRGEPGLGGPHSARAEVADVGQSIGPSIAIGGKVDRLGV